MHNSFSSSNSGVADETKDEVACYAGLMAVALNAVNPCEVHVDDCGFEELAGGYGFGFRQNLDCVDENGELWRSKIAPFGGSPTEGEFLLQPVAMALLAGAGV